MIDINSLKDKLSSLTTVKKVRAIGIDEDKQSSSPSSTKFETAYIDGYWYGFRNNRCYKIGIKFSDLNVVHFRYEKPNIDTPIPDTIRIIECEDTVDYYIPRTNWGPFRPHCTFHGSVINNMVIIDSESINNLKVILQ